MYIDYLRAQVRWLSERKKKVPCQLIEEKEEEEKSRLQDWRSSGDATQHLALVASLSYLGNFLSRKGSFSTETTSQGLYLCKQSLRDVTSAEITQMLLFVSMQASSPYLRIGGLYT